MIAAVLLDAALGYTESSPQWPIFPVGPTKRPLIKTGHDHAEFASTDPSTITRWITREFPDCGIGMPTGAASGTVVIDVDAKHVGEALLAELEDDAALGPLPRVRVVRTRSGGLHIYCAHPGGVRIPSGAGPMSPLGKLLCGRPGVDVRADGGIVVLPPTAGYVWIADDDERPPALPPLWLAALLGAGDPPRPRHTTIEHSSNEAARMIRARAYLAKMPAAISGSGGHSSTFNAVAAMMFGFDLSEAATSELIKSEFNPRCEPPWSERAIEHKLRSVATKCKLARGYLLSEGRI